MKRYKYITTVHTLLQNSLRPCIHFCKTSYEVVLFSNRYVLDGELQHSVPLYNESIQSPFSDGYFLIEKMFVTNRWEKVELTLGDTYGSFGRGLALNIIKNTDLDIIFILLEP